MKFSGDEFSHGEENLEGDKNFTEPLPTYA